MSFLSIQPYVPAISPLADTSTVLAASGTQVPGYKLPVRAGFSTADRPRKVRVAIIPNDNAGLGDGEVRRGMLHDIVV